METPRQYYEKMRQDSYDENIVSSGDVLYYILSPLYEALEKKCSDKLSGDLKASLASHISSMLKGEDRSMLPLLKLDDIKDAEGKAVAILYNGAASYYNNGLQSFSAELSIKAHNVDRITVSLARLLFIPQNNIRVNLTDYSAEKNQGKSVIVKLGSPAVSGTISLVPLYSDDPGIQKLLKLGAKNQKKDNILTSNARGVLKEIVKLLYGEGVC
ncbi:MAG: hypothetical protein WBQ73_01125 [Candidatus Babeliales bacterium]